MQASHFSPDILDFIRLLSNHKVRYVIVGGEAVIYYGYPRLTGDVDFFYGKSDKNINSLFNALSKFWKGDIPGIKKKSELAKPGYIIQFGIPPNRIDLMNTIDGVHFEDAWNEKNSEHLSFGGEEVPIYFLSLKHLLINKKLSGRDKDRDDLSYLENIHPEEP